MTVYTAAALAPSAWPEPMETVYQQLPRWGAAPPGPRRGDLSTAELTLLFPGGVTGRPMAACRAELLGDSRSPAGLCTFLNEAGRRAGQVLEQADWSAVAPFVATRDEKFFHGRAYLLTVHPISLAIVSGHVEDSPDAERWAISRGLDRLKTGGASQRLAEDAANCYPASLAGAANLLGPPWLMPVQKDVFHVLQRTTQTLFDVERGALAKLKVAEKKATHRGRLLHIRRFDGYQSAHQAATATQLAEELTALLELTGRANSASECVNKRPGAVSGRSQELPGPRLVPEHAELVHAAVRPEALRAQQAAWPQPLRDRRGAGLRRRR